GLVDEGKGAARGHGEQFARRIDKRRSIDEPRCIDVCRSDLKEFTTATRPHTKEALLDEVRERYARAAVSVVKGASNTEVNDTLQVIDSCCEPSSGCGGETAAIDDSFGAVLYGSDDQGALPAEAVA